MIYMYMAIVFDGLPLLDFATPLAFNAPGGWVPQGRSP